MQGKLEECRRLMKTVAQNQSAVRQNNEIAQKNTAFFDSYDKFMQDLNSFLIVKEFFDFVPSEKTMASMQKIIKETETIFQTQEVLSLSRYTEQVKECNKLIQQEWSEFSTEYAKSLRNDLGIVSLVAGQKGNVLLRRLNACKTWCMTAEIASDCVKAHQEAEKFLEGMHFDSHVSEFLNKIKSGTATLLDLTPEVNSWLEKENLTEKIFLRIQLS